MLHLAAFSFFDQDLSDVGLWLFLSIGAISLFGIFLPASHWFEARRKEREAFYKAETIRRLTEATGEGAKAAIELLREDDRLQRVKRLEGMKIGGLITLAVGVALSIFVGLIGAPGFFYVAGLVPGLIGVAMLAYVYFLAAPVDGPSGM